MYRNTMLVPVEGLKIWGMHNLEKGLSREKVLSSNSV